jgi:hypothetical protein
MQYTLTEIGTLIAALGIGFKFLQWFDRWVSLKIQAAKPPERRQVFNCPVTPSELKLLQELHQSQQVFMQRSEQILETLDRASQNIHEMTQTMRTHKDVGDEWRSNFKDDLKEIQRQQQLEMGILQKLAARKIQ